jgi:hypothetical protein
MRGQTRFVLAVLTVCGTVRAEPEPLDGFFVDLALGMGYSSGSYSYEGMSNPFDQPSFPLRFDVGLSGAALALTIVPAYALAPSFALGLGLDATILPAMERHGPLGESNVEGALLASASAVAIIRPAPVGFEAQYFLGFQNASVFGSTNEIGSAENIYEHEPARGPRTALRFGYVFENGFGVATTGSFASLRGDHSTYTPLTVVVQGTLNTN